jgi:hypothetical protein
MKFLNGNEAINSFLRKNITLPTLPFSCKNFVETQGFIISLKCKLTKYCFTNSVDLRLLGKLALVDIATHSCFNHLVWLLIFGDFRAPLCEFLWIFDTTLSCFYSLTDFNFCFQFFIYTKNL